jgi:hypothetical protein
LTWGGLELDTYFVKLIADRDPYLFETKSAIVDHSSKNIRTEFNVGMRAKLSMFADAETSFTRNSRLFEDELAQGGNSRIVVW